MSKVECFRCGFEWEIATVRKAENYCTSCRARRVRTVDKDGDKCYPWQGRFAVDLVTPIDENGYLVKPGRRLCGNADCTNSRHIVREES